MSDFDPYLKWLGIRTKRLPVNHYRLLGLDLFEDDPDVISMAADRQMAHVRTYQNGPQGDLSQQILNELARARRCLLMEDKKSNYDAALKTELSQTVVPPVLPGKQDLAPPIAKSIQEPNVEQEATPSVVPVVKSSGPTASDFSFSSSSPDKVRPDKNARVKLQKRETRQIAWSFVGWISGGLTAVAVGVYLIRSGMIGMPNPETDESTAIAILNRRGQPVELNAGPDRNSRVEDREHDDIREPAAAVPANNLPASPSEAPADALGKLGSKNPGDTPGNKSAIPSTIGQNEVREITVVPESPIPETPNNEPAKPLEPEKAASELPDDEIDSFAADPSSSDPSAKSPEPTPRERTAAKKRVSEQVQKTIEEARDIPSKILGAQKLIFAANSQPDAAIKYVVLKEAESLGISAGDAKAAVDALRKIDESFEIDFWKEVHKTIDKASRYSNSITSSDFKQTMDGLIQEARDDGRYDAAGKLLSAAIRLAKHANDTQAAREYILMEKTVDALEDLANSSNKALLVLETNPDDPKSNLDRGNFLLVLNDDVAGALRHWKKCNIRKLVRLAKLESQTNGTDGPKLAMLADAWWEVGKQNRTLQDQKSLERALFLYSQAARLLSGLEKQAAEEKKNELTRLTRNSIRQTEN